MNPEILHPNENLKSAPAKNGNNFEALNEAKILKLARGRKQMLAEIQGHISLKRYYFIEEKLAEEEKKLREILDWQEGRSNKLSKYSYILDPHYFEQELY